MGNEKGNQEGINSKDFLIGTLIGSIIGASAALLLAPKSGKELRQDINQGATKVKEKAVEWKDVAYEKGSEWTHQLQEKSKELTEKVKDTTGQLQDRFRREVSDQAKDLAEAIDEAADEFERKEANDLFEQTQKNE